jgi:hypothetical protein
MSYDDENDKDEIGSLKTLDGDYIDSCVIVSVLVVVLCVS